MGARGNTGDLDAQPFYRFITKTYPLHVVASFAALYAFGGLPALVWGGALRAVWVRAPALSSTLACRLWWWRPAGAAEQQIDVTSFRNVYTAS